MGYKEKFGLKGSFVFSAEIDAYFKNMDFYNDTMHPRFMNSDEFGQLDLKKPVLRHDSVNEEDYTVRVFMNKIEIYIETQTPWRSFGSSYHRKFDHPPTTVEEIESALDELSKYI